MNRAYISEAQMAFGTCMWKLIDEKAIREMMISELSGIVEYKNKRENEFYITNLFQSNPYNYSFTAQFVDGGDCLIIRAYKWGKKRERIIVNKNGQLDGKCIRWFSNGKKKNICYFKNGIENGLDAEFNSKGKLIHYFWRHNGDIDFGRNWLEINHLAFEEYAKRGDGEK